MGHFVEVAPNSSGEYIDTYQVSDGTQNVDRQGIVLVDPTTYAAQAKVQNAEPALTDYGLTMRKVGIGSTLYHAVSAASTNVANIKASAGRITGWTIFSNANYLVYVKFHNTAGTPTAGSGVVYTVGVPPSEPVIFNDDDGIAFSTGIGISIVLGIDDANAIPVALNDCVVNIHWK
jgi:hypothetical protein